MRDHAGILGAPERLRCEYLENPLGMDEPRPRLSWQVRDPRRGAAQRAYQVRVATSKRLLEEGSADVWDSGKVESDRTIQVEYAGRELESRGRYHWQVRSWDARGEASPWSRVQWWEMGFLESDQWKGQWIGPAAPEDDRTFIPCPFLRREFEVGGRIARARIYATAKGLYELQLNGRRVGQDYFTPGWTEYHHRIAYQTYDVTELIREGTNALGAILGDGWYGGHVGGFMRMRLYGPAPRLLVQLELQFEDGSTRIIATDSSWRMNSGPILQSDFMRGEHYDARLEMPGWSEAGFDEGSWRTPVAEPLDEVKLVAQAMPPVRQMQVLLAKSRVQVRPGVWVFDMGQNMVGNVRLDVQCRRSATIQLRYAETLNADGTLYTDNYRTAQSVDLFTARGDEIRENGPRHPFDVPHEIFQPRFTFKGFRYVEVSGHEGEPPLWAVKGIVQYSDNETTGDFECSDPLLNQLYSNIVWSQRDNFLEVPTDCPQRDERLGWMGDAQVFASTACYNMDTAAFFAKWMRDVELAQRADGAFPDVVPNALGMRKDGHLNFDHHAWADAALVIPWTLYLYYGDQRILRRHYQAMARWVEYCRKNSEGLIRPAGGFGDWLSVEVHTPTDLINTAWFARCAWLMRRIATVLGLREDADRYETLFNEIRAAFNQRFVTPQGLVSGDTQTAYLLALAFDLLEDGLRPAAVHRLVEDIRQRHNHLSTGFVGTPWLLPVLSENGRDDTAYGLLHQTTYPSWLFAVTHGATTIWERWDGWTPLNGFQISHMNSLNHYAYGAVGRWMYENIGGIKLDERHPGFTRFVIHPRPHESKLTSARAVYHSIQGTISTEWAMHEDHWMLKVVIPPNTAAEIVLEAKTMEVISERGVPLNQAAGLSECQVERGLVRCIAGAGRYEFVIESMAAVSK
ncbi:MAG: family 78 glycoside hydrolase catalytic domain [Phycisphaerales bacterium]|nr:family 78 glycoside hydrolase catalytic domain [Phycisphaerales bacterium]